MKRYDLEKQGKKPDKKFDKHKYREAKEKL